MKRYAAIGVLCLGCLALNNVVHAADGVYYPGSVWSSTGKLSPVEKGNIISQNVVEQGVAFRGAEVFGSLSTTVDSKGYDWNRRSVTGVGARFTQSLGKGMVRANVVYLTEKRYVSQTSASGVALSVDAWFGWGQKPAARK